MPKNKTHKGLFKRVKITARGKIRHKRSGSSHLMSHMNGKKVRHMRRPLLVSASVARKLRPLLGQVAGR